MNEPNLHDPVYWRKNGEVLSWTRGDHAPAVVVYTATENVMNEGANAAEIYELAVARLQQSLAPPFEYPDEFQPSCIMQS